MIRIEFKKYYKSLAFISFTIFIFVSFFGTSLPFQPKTQEMAEELGSSNLINVILYPVLFFISFVAAFNNRGQIFTIIKKEKLFFIFLIWCLISIFWSDFPLTSFKRWFQIFTYYFIIIVFLSYCIDQKDIIKILKPILILYLSLTIVSILLVPGAKDPDFNTWRGLAAHKNHLGQISLMSLLVSYIIFYQAMNKKEKLVSLILIITSIALIIGTKSSTTIITFLVFITFSMFQAIDKTFKTIGIGRSISLIIFLFLVCLFFITYILFPDILKYITDFFGKDASFSGRTDLWGYILIEISKHPLLGTGFAGFWVNNNPILNQLYAVFIWIPLQSHNGYLDIINETGIIGLILFISLILHYFRMTSKLKLEDKWNWILISTLIINFQETTLFRTGHISYVLFTLGYCLPFSINYKLKVE